MINAEDARALTIHHYDSFWIFLDKNIREAADKGLNVIEVSGTNFDFDIPSKDIVQKTICFENGFEILFCEVDPFYFRLKIRW